MIWSLLQSGRGNRRVAAASDPAGAAAAGGRRHARKTAKAPVLMAEAWARTPSIARTGMPRPVCEAARSAAADSPYLGSGSATKHWFTRASDASPWWLRLPALAGCGSLPRSVGLRCSPPQSSRQTGGSDLCSFHQHASSGHSACFVIRVTQLCRISQVLPPIGSKRRTGSSCHHPYPLKLAADGHCMDATDAGPCCMGVSLSNRKSGGARPSPSWKSRQRCHHIELGPLVLVVHVLMDLLEQCS